MCQSFSLGVWVILVREKDWLEEPRICENRKPDAKRNPHVMRDPYVKRNPESFGVVGVRVVSFSVVCGWRPLCCLCAGGVLRCSLRAGGVLRCCLCAGGVRRCCLCRGGVLRCCLSVCGWRPSVLSVCVRVGSRFAYGTLRCL